jgi:hypothetical protein
LRLDGRNCGRSNPHLSWRRTISSSLRVSSKSTLDRWSRGFESPLLRELIHCCIDSLKRALVAAEKLKLLIVECNKDVLDERLL